MPPLPMPLEIIIERHRHACGLNHLAPPPCLVGKECLLFYNRQSHHFNYYSPFNFIHYGANFIAFRFER